MLYPLLITMLLSPFRPCESSPTFQEEYRGSFVPNVIETWRGLQIVAPDTPYVAAAGQNQLYFIDTRFDPETAKHVKEQIERASVPGGPNEVMNIDEISATAEVKNTLTGETIFIFDPPYARVLFAKGINKRNPELKLPEHEPAGDWLVTYDLGDILTKRRLSGSDYGSHSNGDCIHQTNCNCRLCHHYRAVDQCDAPLTNDINTCHPLCHKAVDTPKKDGETDASYYQQMDKLHWA
ncbi:hypothetical protein EDB81DRAFT_692775 [Dactylonectria macrodidyma]|uniref:Uncharacterized protein n=1 Tax=Dactylonectria macrodidyma TaxID=307937 RepID=A0A9P9J2R3_9HYPO|nr:hypothetical protein EDB81DRAFT_692775 [Dactylonectria macrodidyma]